MPSNQPEKRGPFPPPETLSAPPEVRTLARSLRAAGGQAWVVGGAVRDLLLGRAVQDWDLATNLLPEQVRGLFSRTLEVGIRFGTVRVWLADRYYEVTTFRRDGAYSDARRPDAVQFTRAIEDDLLRRDFTVNALAWDPLEGALVDPAGGRTDLAARLIRAVGDPEERFTEDALRLLRAVRFAAQLEFEIEPETYRGLVLCAAGLERVSVERVREELEKLLQAARPSSGLALLLETGLLRRILPELASTYGVSQNRYHAYDVFHHTLAAVDAAAPENRIVRLAALFHDLGKPETRAERDGGATFYAHQAAGRRLAERALRRLRYSNEDRSRVTHLVRHHMFHYRPEWTDSAVRRFLREVGPEHLDDLFALRAADTMGNGRRRRPAPQLAALRTRVEEEIRRQNALSVRDLAIDGHDLMDELALFPGPEVGRILRALLEEVVENPAANEREHLLARARVLHASPPSAQP